MKSTIQTTLLGDAMQSAKTNKKEFLEKMDSLIPCVYSAPSATLARSNSHSVPTEPHCNKTVHPLTKFHKHSLLNLTFCGENAPIKMKLP